LLQNPQNTVYGSDKVTVVCSMVHVINKEPHQGAANLQTRPSDLYKNGHNFLLQGFQQSRHLI